MDLNTQSLYRLLRVVISKTAAAAAEETGEGGGSTAGDRHALVETPG